MPRFANLPPEIRYSIIDRLLDKWRVLNDVEALTPYATVCREWQAIIERYTFASLNLSLDRLGSFGNFVQFHRRRCLREIRLRVELPEYPNDPCEVRETWEDKVANNQLFTQTIKGLFDTLNGWPDHQVCQGGIHLFFAVSSKSDLRNSDFELWQRRRWNSKDIGEKRFAESYIDFVGQDEELNRTCLLRPVYAITSFETCPLIRRSILPAAYGDIITRLPRLKNINLDLMKERKLLVRRAIFDHLGDLMHRWPVSLETLSISTNTICSWRMLPHETISEADSGEKLCEQLRLFGVQLKELRLSNLVRIREFFRPVWPTRGDDDDKGPFQKLQSLPCYPHMRLVHVHYGAIYYKPEWHEDVADVNEHEDTLYFRQCISLAAARMAYAMPRLEEMVVAQRPMMWLGKHRLAYSAAGAEARVTWTSTFDFEPWERTVEAWTEVARKHAGKRLTVEVVKVKNWQTDGMRPLTPHLAF